MARHIATDVEQKMFNMSLSCFQIQTIQPINVLIWELWKILQKKYIFEKSACWDTSVALHWVHTKWWPFCLHSSRTERLKLPNFLVVLADKQRRWVISWLLHLQVYHLTITKHWTASFITEFLNARIFVRASNFFRYQLHGSWIFLDYVGRVLKILVTFLPNLPTRSPL